LSQVLEAKAVKPDENAMYLYTNFLEMIWPYDDRGRLIGEDVWEPDPDKAEIIKLDPEDVLTTQQAATLLAPLIKPLPSDNYFGSRYGSRLGCWTIQTACTCMMHVAAPRPREGLLSEVRHAVEGPRSGHPTAKCRLPHPWRGGARLRGLKAWS
jgi:hypothetical protein